MVIAGILTLGIAPWADRELAFRGTTFRTVADTQGRSPAAPAVCRSCSMRLTHSSP